MNLLGPKNDTRFAFVLGNGDYPDDGKLANPQNDAHAFASTLKRLGFKVTLHTDLTFRVAKRAVEQFREKLKKNKATDCIFYYSGHGLQVDSTNYIVPIDAESIDEHDDLNKLISVQEVILDLTKQAKTCVVFLDACRKNPFAEKLTERVHESKPSVEKSPDNQSENLAKPKSASGLARIDTPKGSNTFIAFAAGPGEVAWDGTGHLSLFSGALVKHIGAADISIENLMIRVRNDVLSETERRQQPWDHSSLVSTYSFNPGPLISLSGNIIGLTACLFAVIVYSLSLVGVHCSALGWPAAGFFILLTTFFFFIRGLQQSYEYLKGSTDDLYRDAAENKIERLGKGLVGGFLGGVISGAFTMASYFFFSAESFAEHQNVSFCVDSATEKVLDVDSSIVEITLACMIISTVLGGLIAYFIQRISITTLTRWLTSTLLQSGMWFGYRRPNNQTKKANSKKNRVEGWVDYVSSALLAGMGTGLLVGPPIGLYFGLKNLPPIEIKPLLPGALVGTIGLIFSILNYRLERLNYKQLGIGVFCSMVSVVGIFALVALLDTIFPIFSEYLLEYLVIDHKPPLTRGEVLQLLTGGLFYGTAIGAVLGGAVGVSLVLDTLIEERMLISLDEESSRLTEGP